LAKVNKKLINFMAGKVIFKLDKENSRGEFSIYLVYRYDDKKLVYPTNEKTIEKNWNSKTQRLREGREQPENKDINQYFDKLESNTKIIYHQYRNDNKELDNDVFRKELNERVKNIVVKEAKTTLYDFIRSSMMERKSTVRESTAKVNRRFFALLQAFGKEQGKEIDFQDITVEFAYKFLDFMYSEPYEFSTNYVSKMFDNLHLFVHEAYDRELHSNKAYTKDAFRIGKTLTYAIALTEDELNRIFEYDFSDNERLAKARDLFLLGCYTGLRFSDYSNLKLSHFQTIKDKDKADVTVIRKVTQKTDTPVVIPVVKEVKEILQRNGGNLPESITNQKLNDYIKEVAQIVGIDKEIIFPVNKGGVSKEQTFKRYDLVKTHTARRTFATNAYKKGIPSRDIMLITGHKTETEFIKYVRISNDENAVSVAKKLGA
jgi:integrase